MAPVTRQHKKNAELKTKTPAARRRPVVGNCKKVCKQAIIEQQKQKKHNKIQQLEKSILTLRTQLEEVSGSMTELKHTQLELINQVNNNEHGWVRLMADKVYPAIWKVTEVSEKFVEFKSAMENRFVVAEVLE